jgi:hypothetical protein
VLLMVLLVLLVPMLPVLAARVVLGLVMVALLVRERMLVLVLVVPRHKIVISFSGPT